MKHKKYFLITLFAYISFNHSTQAQIGINTSNPKSTLDVSFSNNANSIDGIQAPRLTLTELTTKGDALYGTDQKGVFIYITDVSGGNKIGQRTNITSPGYYYFDGNLWQEFVYQETTLNLGDVINSFNATDHNGWYLLDGRAISSLPANIRTTAQSLGFNSNLPDARDRVLKAHTGSETLGSTGGANSITITKDNLPNINLSGTISGTAASAGAHTHTVSSTLAASGDHTHAISGSLVAGGAHSHSISGSLAAGGGHTHGVSGSLQSAGAHSHTSESILVVTDVDRASNRTGPAIYNYQSIATLNTSSAGAHTHSVSATLTAGGGHTHPVNGTTLAADAHAHTVSSTLASDGAHTHTVSSTLASTGAHAHTVNGTTNVSLGGSGTALNKRPAYLVVNTFIYLGK